MHLEVHQPEGLKKAQEKVIFSHKYSIGQSLISYGIYVAKLAGLPLSLLERAKEVHKELSQSQNLKAPKLQSHAVIKPLVVASSSNTQESTAHNINERKVLKQIQTLDLNELSPKDALLSLYEFKEKLEQDKKPISGSKKTNEKTLF